MKIEITIEPLARGHKVLVSHAGKEPVESYCAKLHEVPQAVKDVLAKAFPKPEPKKSK